MKTYHSIELIQSQPNTAYYQRAGLPKSYESVVMAYAVVVAMGMNKTHPLRILFLLCKVMASHSRHRVDTSRKGIHKFLAASSSVEAKTRIESQYPKKHGYKDGMMIAYDATQRRLLFLHLEKMIREGKGLYLNQTRTCCDSLRPMRGR